MFLKTEIEIALKHHNKFNLTSYLERKVKNRLTSHVTPDRMTVIKKINNKKFCKCVDKEKSYILLVGMETSPATVRISIEISQNLTVDLSYDPPVLLLGIYSMGSESTYPSDTYTSMFAAALFTILNYRSNLSVQYRGMMKKIVCIHNEPFFSCKEQSDVVYKKKRYNWKIF